MIPIGGIINWSGAIAAIPSNYQLCDGTNGTPNLRDKFVVGAGTSYAVDAAGGAASHVHSIAIEQNGDNLGGADVVRSDETGSTSNLPPYLALAYIQRMT